MANYQASNQTAEFDIVIVGGGMVGLAMAASLADTSLKIALVERSNLEQLLNSQFSIAANNERGSCIYQSRVSAISPGSQAFLTQLNCWQHLAAVRVADYEKMQVWNADGSGEVSFDAAMLAQKYLGAIVENDHLRAAIFSQLKTKSNITILDQIEISAIELCQADNLNSAPQSIISLQQNFTQTNASSDTSGSEKTGSSKKIEQSIKTSLVIAADGGLSVTRQLFKIGVSETAYQQKAFVVNVKTERAHQATAWQRFNQTGPVAFLPLAQANTCSVVWSVDNKQAAALSLLNNEAFALKLNQAFEERLGKIELLTEPQSFALTKRHAQRYLAPGCVLIGDAAHTIHPLAGQGVNLGFQDVACLSHLIIQLLDKGRSINLMANLRPYERERSAENKIMQESMSMFKWLFAQSNLPVTLMRNWGMSALNRAEWVKQIIIKRAMS
jgi:2-polyprenylphenol 6-hydroxylase